jgi:glycosyltransferase involved in cell wall biosynthesis
LNAAQDLPLTIESVINQTRRDIEYIFVDGLSWDQTGEIMKRYGSHFSRIVKMEDGGIYPAMNAALEHVTASHVLFLNAGDRLYRADTIETILERASPQADIFTATTFS